VNRIIQIDPTQATGKTKQDFDDLEVRLGFVPNLFRVLANAPAALDGYLNFSAALAGGSLDSKVREQIALAVAASNLCGYCLSAHAFLAGKVGLSQRDIADAIRATAVSGRTDAILKLARSVVVQRAEVGDSDLAQARAAGLTDGEIVETVANVVLNIFSNYVTHVARILADFPQVRPGDPSA
jgi:uncharacterized peroxidase-related enzyme